MATPPVDLLKLEELPGALKRLYPKEEEFSFLSITREPFGGSTSFHLNTRWDGCGDELVIERVKIDALLATIGEVLGYNGGDRLMYRDEITRCVMEGNGCRLMIDKGHQRGRVVPIT